MIQPHLILWSFSLCFGLLCGCVGASNWVSGSAQLENAYIDSSQHFASIRTGVTTKHETLTRFGNPSDRQSHMIDGVISESWSYATTETIMKPYQYLPFIGAVAFWEPLWDQAPSAAISFSHEEKVSGLTVSTVNAYGDIPSPDFFSVKDSPTSFYGMRNPDVFHTSADTMGNPR